MLHAAHSGMSTVHLMVDVSCDVKLWCRRGSFHTRPSTAREYQLAFCFMSLYSNDVTLIFTVSFIFSCILFFHNRVTSWKVITFLNMAGRRLLSESWSLAYSMFLNYQRSALPCQSSHNKEQIRAGSTPYIHSEHHTILVKGVRGFL